MQFWLQSLNSPINKDCQGPLCGCQPISVAPFLNVPLKDALMPLLMNENSNSVPQQKSFCFPSSRITATLNASNDSASLNLSSKATRVGANKRCKLRLNLISLVVPSIFSFEATEEVKCRSRGVSWVLLSCGQEPDCREVLCFSSSMIQTPVQIVELTFNSDYWKYAVRCLIADNTQVIWLIADNVVKCLIADNMHVKFTFWPHSSEGLVPSLTWESKYHCSMQRQFLAEHLIAWYEWKDGFYWPSYEEDLWWQPNHPQWHSSAHPDNRPEWLSLSLHLYLYDNNNILLSFAIWIQIYHLL